MRFVLLVMVLFLTVCCAFSRSALRRNKLTEGEKKKLKETLPKDPPRNQNCGNSEYSAADIAACENYKHDAHRFDNGDIDIPYVHRRRRVTAHWLAWPKNEDGNVYIPYFYEPSVVPNISIAFEQAIQDFNELTCIRLVPWTGELNYISLFSGSGCYTYLGMSGGRQPLSLQAYTGCAQKGVAIHEIMHVLGFYHEMARRDRDEHIIIHFDNIYTNWWDQFEMHPYANGSVWGEEYDVQSIMHYGNKAAAIDTSRKSITSVRDPSEILGQRYGMSPKDREQINKMYHCNQFVSVV